MTTAAEIIDDQNRAEPPRPDPPRRDVTPPDSKPPRQFRRLRVALRAHGRTTSGQLCLDRPRRPPDALALPAPDSAQSTLKNAASFAATPPSKSPPPSLDPRRHRTPDRRPTSLRRGTHDDRPHLNRCASRVPAFTVRRPACTCGADDVSQIGQDDLRQPAALELRREPRIAARSPTPSMTCAPEWIADALTFPAGSRHDRTDNRRALATGLDRHPESRELFDAIRARSRPGRRRQLDKRNPDARLEAAKELVLRAVRAGTKSKTDLGQAIKHVGTLDDLNTAFGSSKARKKLLVEQDRTRPGRPVTLYALSA